MATLKEQTLAILKPDAVNRLIIGNMIAVIEQNNFDIIGMKMVKLTIPQAECFYNIHKGKYFFSSLVEFMTSGRIVVMALSGENAIARWRTLMGATDPAFAANNTMRKLFATSQRHNACHGSDSPETAQTELAFFFKETELITLF